MATKKMLSETQVREADANPFGRRQPQTAPLPLAFTGSSFTIVYGNNVIFGVPVKERVHAIAIDNDPLLYFDFRDGHLLLSMRMSDWDERPILEIEESELTYSTDAIDISFVGNQLCVEPKEEKNLLPLKMRFLPPDRVVVEQGLFIGRGVAIMLKSDGLMVLNNNFVMSETSQAYTRGGLVISNGATSLPSTIRCVVPQEKRYRLPNLS